MKNLFLAILGLGLAIGIYYFYSQPRPDETKVEASPEAMMAPSVSQDNSTKTIDAELSETIIDSFDQDLNELDGSINQL